MAIETFKFSLYHWNMALIKLNRAIDLQIQIAEMAVLENIYSHTLPDGSLVLSISNWAICYGLLRSSSINPQVCYIQAR